MANVRSPLPVFPAEMGSRVFSVNFSDTPLDEDVASLAERFGNWQIRPDILYLDNGAFGACPVSVSETQRDIRQSIEVNPHDFFERSYLPALQVSKEALASFINADSSGLIIVPGATYGLNAVIQSLSFDKDDEILTTNHAYSSVQLALEHVGRRDSACLDVVDVPFPLASPETILHKILAHVTPRTRLAVIDHIPSRSGCIFPIKQIVAALDSHNVDTLVDGAHTPGMIDLDLKDINAAYYAANCHKWMCTPRGVGFLHVRADRIHNIKPLVIARSRHVVEPARYSALEHGFTWLGTYDPSAPLSLPSSINFLRTVVPGGHKALVKRNHRLAVLARKVVCEALGIQVPCPDDMIGAMATIPLPDSVEPQSQGMLPLQETLWRKYGIVIPVYSWPSYPKRVIRLSVQVYNTFEQYLRLADCLKSILHSERGSGLSAPSRKYTTSSESEQLNPNERPSCDFISGESFWRYPPHMNHCAEETSLILKRMSEDIDRPTPWLIYRLAQLRIRRIAAGTFASYSISVYPTAGEDEVQFAAIGAGTRHPNTEISRMTYMLTCVQSRRIPQATVTIIQQLLNGGSIIEEWPNHAGMLKNRAQALTRIIISDMRAPQAPGELPVDCQSFISCIVPYATEALEHNLSRSLWLRSTAEFAEKVKAGCLSGVKSFLQIHAFLKDPIGGLRRDIRIQTQLFVSLLKDFKSDLGETTLASEIWEEIVTQLALESSFLAIPEVQHSVHIHFAADQQLVYSYVDIDNLGRSEFACPDIVINMMREMIDCANIACLMAPITIAYAYPLYHGSGTRPIIVDGNNRATAVALLRFISVHGLPEAGCLDTVREHCQDHGLGPVWFVDLCAALRVLWDAADSGLLGRLGDSERLSQFRRVQRAPVLITEEPSFLTKAMDNHGETFLQPVHQSIFAADDTLAALQSKAQQHGRPKGFKLLPLR